jgi:hypothetical protein
MTMTSKQSVWQGLRRWALVGIGSAALFACGCGRADNLVLVSVQGLDSSITELLVTMKLDGVQAKNQVLSPDDPDMSSFTVYKNMQEFGVEVPTGTQTLGMTINGLNTSRVVVKTGDGTLDLSKSKNLDVTLHLP